MPMIGFRAMGFLSSRPARPWPQPLDELRDVIEPGETVVCILTGHGLKNSPSIT